jgi:hypothetical protein
MGDALLTHEGDGYDTYDQTLFYAVRLSSLSLVEQCLHARTPAPLCKLFAWAAKQRVT